MKELKIKYYVFELEEATCHDGAIEDIVVLAHPRISYSKGWDIFSYYYDTEQDALDAIRECGGKNIEYTIVKAYKVEEGE